MRIPSVIRRPRLRIAAAGSAAVLALCAAGVGLAPAAGAAAAGPAARSAAGTVRPDEKIGPIYGGTLGSLEECKAALQGLAANPQYGGGMCVPAGNGRYKLYYYWLVSACGPIIPAGTVAGKPAVTPDC